MITNDGCNHKVHTEWMKDKIIKHNKIFPPRPLKWSERSWNKRVSLQKIKNEINDPFLLLKFEVHQQLSNFVITNHRKSLKSYCFKCDDKFYNHDKIEECKRNNHHIISLINLFKVLRLKSSENYDNYVQIYKSIVKLQIAKLAIKIKAKKAN